MRVGNGAEDGESFAGVRAQTGIAKGVGRPPRFRQDLAEIADNLIEIAGGSISEAARGYGSTGSISEADRGYESVGFMIISAPRMMVGNGATNEESLDANRLQNATAWEFERWSMISARPPSPVTRFLYPPFSKKLFRKF